MPLQHGEYTIDVIPALNEGKNCNGHFDRRQKGGIKEGKFTNLIEKNLLNSLICDWIVTSFASHG